MLRPCETFGELSLLFAGGAQDGMNPSSPSFGTKDVSAFIWLVLTAS